MLSCQKNDPGSLTQDKEIAMEQAIPLAFGDVKVFGRITARTNIGDTLALRKISPIPVSGVSNTREYKLPHTSENPTVYNVLYVGPEGQWEYYFLPDERIVMFFPDFPFQ